MAIRCIGKDQGGVARGEEVNMVNMQYMAKAKCVEGKSNGLGIEFQEKLQYSCLQWLMTLFLFKFIIKIIMLNRQLWAGQ